MITDPGLKDVIAEFLDRQERRLKSGDLAKSPPQKKEEIEVYLTNARMAIEYRDPYEVALYFLYLGKNVAEADFPEKGEVDKLVKADKNRKKALNEASSKSKPLKIHAQEIADRRWKNDKKQGIRIGGMVKKIKKELETKAQEMRVELPKDETVKRWLREIAPPYASEPGADRK